MRATRMECRRGVSCLERNFAKKGGCSVAPERDVQEQHEIQHVPSREHSSIRRCLLRQDERDTVFVGPLRP